MSVAIPYIAADLHLSPVAMGAVMSVLYATYSISQIPGGLLADKFGLRRVAAIALFGTSVFTGFTGAALSSLQLIFTRALVGSVEGLYPACSFKAIATWFPRSERATANSIMYASSWLGAVLAPLIVVALVSLWSWRAAFIVLTLPGIICAALIWYFVGDRPSPSTNIPSDETKQEVEEVPDGRPPTTVRESLLQLLDPLLLKYAIASITFGMAWAGFSMWLPTYLVRVRGFPAAEMGMIASLTFFTGMVGSALGGWISDRYFREDRRIPIVFAEIIAAGMILCIFFTESTAVLIICQCVAAFLMMSRFTAFWALPMNTVPAENMGVVSGFLNSADSLAMAIMPIVVGVLIEVSGGGFGLTFACIIAFLLISSAIVMTLPVKFKSQTSEFRV